MPYLQVELDAMDKWPMVATGCGIPEDKVYRGFLDLWKTCWKEKSAHVDIVRLECFFGMPGRGERAAQVLIAFGFLEAHDGGGYRVCGAEKYLRITEARSIGGKKASGNLKRGKAPGSSRKAAGKQPEKGPGSDPALTSIIEHQSSSSRNIAGEKPPADDSREPGYSELVEDLFSTFRSVHGKDPQPSGRDWKRLKELRARAKDDREIGVRWGRGLVAEFGRHVDTFAELYERWDKLASADPPKRAGNARFFAAQDADKNAFAKVGVVNDF